MLDPKSIAALVDRAEHLAIIERWPIATLPRVELRRYLAEAMIRLERAEPTTRPVPHG